MMKKLLCCVSSMILLLSCSSTEKISPPPSIPCSVLPLESGTGMNAGESASVTEMLTAALQNTGRFTVIERKQMNAVRQEQEFQTTQNSEDAVKTGKILSVRKMISGSIGRLGRNYNLNIKMIDVETSRVEYAHSWTYDDDLEDIGKDFLPKAVQELIKSLDQAKEK